MINSNKTRQLLDKTAKRLKKLNVNRNQVSSSSDSTSSDSDSDCLSDRNIVERNRKSNKIDIFKYLKNWNLRFDSTVKGATAQGFIIENCVYSNDISDQDLIKALLRISTNDA